jgi:ABC-type multidrug transport system fused ATPase/permease subunit
VEKGRIQLSRVVYSDRKIYILDDHMSAVDAHVGRVLFEECIMRKSKRRDAVIVMYDGSIVEQDTAQLRKDEGIDF